MTNPITTIRDADLGSIRADFEVWCRGDRKLDETRAKAIEEVMRGVLDGTDALLAERTWGFFRHVIGQRESLLSGQDVERLDALATDGYLAIVGAVGPTPPIVCLDPSPTPRMLVRSPLRMLGRGMPIPVVFVPPTYVLSPWLLTTVHHELGHVVDTDRGVTVGLAPRVDASLGDATAGERVTWRRWLAEIVCDAVALTVAGPAFAWSLAAILDRLAVWKTWDESGEHPPAAVRIMLLGEMMRRRKVPVSPELEARVAEAAQHAREKNPRIAAQLPAVGAAVISEVGALVGTDGAGDRATVDAALEAIRGGGDPDAGTSLRLIPSIAQLALVEAGRPAEWALRRSRTFLAEAKAPEWTATATDWKALRGRARDMTTTILDTDRRKVPPPELLREHQVISFVGATHRQLAASLASAFQDRKQQRWKRIEVFFATDATLEAMPGGLVAAKAAALPAVRAQLDHAESWAIYEFERPYFFASYWDITEPHGRIHVSPYVWGEDISTCPAVDYFGGVAPSPAYAAYARGLEALRRSARVIESSER